MHVDIAAVIVSGLRHFFISRRLMIDSLEPAGQALVQALHNFCVALAGLSHDWDVQVFVAARKSLKLVHSRLVLSR
jgi:hypothetical protein